MEVVMLDPSSKSIVDRRNESNAHSIFRYGRSTHWTSTHLPSKIICTNFTATDHYYFYQQTISPSFTALLCSPSSYQN